MGAKFAPVKLWDFFGSNVATKAGTFPKPKATNGNNWKAHKPIATKVVYKLMAKKEKNWSTNWHALVKHNARTQTTIYIQWRMWGRL